MRAIHISDDVVLVQVLYLAVHLFSSSYSKILSSRLLKQFANGVELHNINTVIFTNGHLADKRVVNKYVILFVTLTPTHLQTELARDNV